MSEKVKKPWYKKWWVWLIVVVVLIGAFGNSEDSETDVSENINDTKVSIAEGDSEKPAEDTVTKTDDQEKQEQKEVVKEEEKPIVIDAVELSKAFNDNEIKANKDYEDKIAKISGEISDIGEVLGSTYVVLAGVDMAFVDIQCFFKDKAEIDKIADKSKGDKVTIIGKIEGKSINVDVKNCKFE
jgi:hypothetical protein